MNNRPLSRYKQRRLLFCFALELTATQAAKVASVNRNTANLYYRGFRLAVFLHQQREFEKMVGEIEMDESYFGGVRKGLKGRSTKQKVPVFGLLKRQDKVFTQVVPNVKAITLRRIIKERVDHASILFTDSYKSYDGLVTDGYEHHRINHSKGELVKGRSHINGIESFWSYAKNKLSRYYGIRRQDFPLYLKELEWRFNLRGEDPEKELLKIVDWKTLLKLKRPDAPL